MGEFAHISRPVVRVEMAAHRLLDQRRFAAEALGGTGEEVAEQQRDILAPLAQRRDADEGDVQAVIEVLAEAAAPDQILEIDLRGRHHADVDAADLVGAERHDFPRFEHAQHLHLERRRHRLDLVEKQRAAARMLDAADPLLERAGEGARFMAEQLALDDVLRQRPAIHRDEGAGAARAPAVQRLRHHLLAAAGLALHQHVDVGVGDLPHPLAQPLHLRRMAEQRQIEGRRLRLAAERAVLEDEAPLVERMADRDEQPVERVGLGDEVIGAFAHRLDRHGDVAMAGDQDHRQLGVEAPQPAEQFEAVDPRHAHVADHDPGKSASRSSSAAMADG